MPAKLRNLTLVAVTALALLQAQPKRIAPVRGERKLALVIGNAAYPKAPLKNPSNDAQAVGTALKDSGFEVTVKQNLTLQQMEEAVDRFTSGLQSGDFALFYYSGHGVQFQGDNYLVPVDYAAASGSDVKYKSYAASRVRDKLEESGARVRLLVLDACRDNPFRSSKTTAGGLAQMKSDASGTLIAFATGDGQTAEDNPAERNGLYTKHLLAAMKQPDLDVRAVFRKAGDDVFAASNRRQRPFLYDGLTGETLFFRNAPPAAASSDLAAVAYEQVKGSHNRAMLEAFVKEFSDSQYAKLARIELAGLGVPAAPVADTTDEGKRLHMDGRHEDEVAAYRRGAEAGNARAMADLGYAYQNGEGVARNDQEAFKWYTKAVELGDARAKARLANLYGTGRGVPQDGARAFALSREAADAGDESGFVVLGNCYTNGWGVAKDELEAARFYRKAADTGNAVAMANLGYMYSTGRGVTADKAEAYRWYRKSADAGAVPGMLRVGVAYDSGDGVAKDQAEAARWYRKAADAGDAQAIANLGRLYRYGLGVRMDSDEALRWFRKGADGADPYSMNQIGLMYREGIAVAKDEVEATRWFRKGAEGGNVDAMVDLGYAYMSGNGVEKDYTEAVRWTRKAAEAGNTSAMHNLGASYEQGLGVSKDSTEAALWFQKGATGGNASCMLALGRYYEAGTGVPKDLSAALSWYQKAADKGNADARAAIDRLQTPPPPSRKSKRAK